MDVAQLRCRDISYREAEPNACDFRIERRRKLLHPRRYETVHPTKHVMVPNAMINSGSRRALNGQTAWLCGTPIGPRQENQPAGSNQGLNRYPSDITGDSTDTVFLSDLVSHPPRPPNKAQDSPTPRMRTVLSGPASKLLTVNHDARSEDIGSGKVTTGFASHSSLVLGGAGTR